MLKNIIKTAPRDCRILSRHIKSLLELRTLEKNGASVGKAFDAIVKMHPNKPAILFKDQVWTFKQVCTIATCGESVQ